MMRWPSGWSSNIEAARDVVGVDLGVVLVVVLVDLLEDERALELDIAEPRAAEQLAEQVERRRRRASGSRAIWNSV